MICLTNSHNAKQFMLRYINRISHTMKVKYLIVELSKIDQNLDVFGYSESNSIATEQKPFRFFLIEDVSVNQAILSRGRDGSPQALFDNGPNSKRFALINMDSDF